MLYVNSGYQNWRVCKGENFMNKDILKGKWKEIKGQVKKHWGNLTDDELDKVNGQAEELSGLLQKKYGYDKQRAEKEIDQFLKSKEDK